MNGEWTEMKMKTKQKHILIVRLELFAFVCDSLNVVGGEAEDRIIYIFQKN